MRGVWPSGRRSLPSLAAWCCEHRGNRSWLETVPKRLCTTELPAIQKRRMCMGTQAAAHDIKCPPPPPRRYAASPCAIPASGVGRRPPRQLRKAHDFHHCRATEILGSTPGPSDIEQAARTWYPNTLVSPSRKAPERPTGRHETQHHICLIASDGPLCICDRPRNMLNAQPTARLLERAVCAVYHRTSCTYRRAKGRRYNWERRRSQIPNNDTRCKPPTSRASTVP